MADRPRISDIATALVDAISAASLSQPVTVRRSWMPRQDKHSGSLRGNPLVTVYPQGRIPGVLTRGQESNLHRISVAVQKLLDHPEDDGEQRAEIDGLVYLAEEISDLLHMAELTAVPSVHWSGTEHDPLCDYTMLLESQVFTSVLQISYTEYRTR